MNRTLFRCQSSYWSTPADAWVKGNFPFFSLILEYVCYLSSSITHHLILTGYLLVSKNVCCMLSLRLGLLFSFLDIKKTSMSVGLHPVKLTNNLELSRFFPLNSVVLQAWSRICSYLRVNYKRSFTAYQHIFKSFVVWLGNRCCYLK